MVAEVQVDVVYSGGDDGCFKGWDLRIKHTVPAALFTDRQSHRAGVCTIASDPHQPFVLATGSYDENLRLWDARNPSGPFVAQQVRSTFRLRTEQCFTLFPGCMWWRSVEIEVSSTKEGKVSFCLHARWI